LKHRSMKQLRVRAFQENSLLKVDAHFYET